MDSERVFDLLRHDYRHAIVAILHETSPIARQKLVATLAARGFGMVDDAEGRTELTAHRRIRIALHHNHLPRLDEAGVVEYDDEMVAATPELELAAEHLDDTNLDAVNPNASLNEQLAEFYA